LLIRLVSRARDAVIALRAGELSGEVDVEIERFELQGCSILLSAER